MDFVLDKLQGKTKHHFRMLTAFFKMLLLLLFKTTVFHIEVAFYLNDAFQGMGTITCKPPFRVGVMSGGFCKIKLVKMEKLDEPAEVYV